MNLYLENHLEVAKMSKKKTKLHKSTGILSDSKATQWCYVNTDNEFTFMNSTFIIDESVEDYKVRNKAGQVEDFTNEAYMEEVLAVLGTDGYMKFYNQNYNLIKDVCLLVKRK